MKELLECHGKALPFTLITSCLPPSISGAAHLFVFQALFPPPRL